MKIIEYFKQTEEEQKNWREQILQGDWRAAKFLYEVLEKNELQERYGAETVTQRNSSTMLVNWRSRTVIGRCIFLPMKLAYMRNTVSSF